MSLLELGIGLRIDNASRFFLTVVSDLALFCFCLLQVYLRLNEAHGGGSFCFTGREIKERHLTNEKQDSSF